MKFIQTTAVKKILGLKKRLRIIQGGSSAGRTVAILLVMIDKAQTVKGNLASVVSESMPHLRRAAIRDFLAIMEGHGYYREASWDRTNMIYTFETGSKIEFFSADQSDKVRGPRRNDLFLNECNNIDYETYTQLAIRTDGDIYLDYNPVSSFWVHEEIIQRGQDHDFLVLTYKDNEGLSPAIIQELEARKDRKGWWTVFGLGLVGEIEGKIYNDWRIIDELPHEAQLIRYGLDYGYTNDPTAIVAIYKYNNGFIWDEVTYQKGLSNRQIADILLNQPKALVVPDSAEPKSNDELVSYGVNILPANKGRGSVQQGIQYVQSQRISVTKRSTNIIREYRNYLWRTDRNGKFIVPNEPEHAFSHSMDAGRYAMESNKPVAELTAEQRARNFLEAQRNRAINTR